MNIEGMTANQMIDVMIKFQITARQFMLLMLLEIDRQEQSGQIAGDSSAIAQVYKFAEGVEKWSFEEIDDLVAKGLLIDHNTNAQQRGSYPDHFEVTELFISAVMSTWTDFEEFWEAYPSFVDNFDDFRAPKIPLKASDFDDVQAKYRKYVRTAAKHQKVLELLKWGVKNDHVKMNIGKFVGSRGWDQLQELRSQPSSSRQSVTIM